MDEEQINYLKENNIKIRDAKWDAKVPQYKHKRRRSLQERSIA